jgi:lambda repressor-like predicted transcriptional regulator
MAQQPAGWHREEIKDELRKRFGSIRALSLKWGYNRCAIASTLANVSYSQRLEKRIATVLGVVPHVLWPDRWDHRGEPLPRTGGKTNSTRQAAPNRQKSRAA